MGTVGVVLRCLQQGGHADVRLAGGMFAGCNGGGSAYHMAHTHEGEHTTDFFSESILAFLKH